MLRNVEANNQDSGAAAKSSSLLSSFRSSSSYNHETETIFALPRMQLDFKSIHVQDPDEPSLTGGAGKSFLLLFLGSDCIFITVANIVSVTPASHHQITRAAQLCLIFATKKI